MITRGIGAPSGTEERGMAERQDETGIERVTVAEVANRLGVSTSTVRRRIAAGELRATREGRRLWVLVADAGAEVSLEAAPANVTPFPAPAAPPPPAPASHPGPVAVWAVRDRRTLGWLGATPGRTPKFVGSLQLAAHFASAGEAVQAAATLSRGGWSVEVRSVFVEALAA